MGLFFKTSEQLSDMGKTEEKSSLYRVAMFFWVITISLVAASFLILQNFIILSIAAIITAIVNFILGCFAAIRAEFEESGK
jgi:hypothetical protein